MALGKKKGKKQGLSMEVQKGIPSGATTIPGPEQEWFVVLETFPTMRRPIAYKRPWDVSYPVGEEYESWLIQIGIKIGGDLTTGKRE